MIKIINPPITLQNNFAEKVEKIEIQKQKMQKSLKDLEQNFSSLMQRAFKGEI
jgi:type I restriction enzyme S subunit